MGERFTEHRSSGKAAFEDVGRSRAKKRTTPFELGRGQGTAAELAANSLREYFDGSAGELKNYAAKLEKAIIDNEGGSRVNMAEFNKLKFPGSKPQSLAKAGLRPDDLVELLALLKPSESPKEEADPSPDPSKIKTEAKAKSTPPPSPAEHGENPPPRISASWEKNAKQVDEPKKPTPIPPARAEVLDNTKDDASRLAREKLEAKWKNITTAAGGEKPGKKEGKAATAETKTPITELDQATKKDESTVLTELALSFEDDQELGRALDLARAQSDALHTIDDPFTSLPDTSTEPTKRKSRREIPGAKAALARTSTNAHNGIDPLVGTEEELPTEAKFDLALVPDGIKSAFKTPLALRTYLGRARETAAKKGPLKILLPSNPPETLEQLGATQTEAQRFIDKILPELDREVEERTRKAIPDMVRRISSEYTPEFTMYDADFAPDADRKLLAEDVDLIFEANQKLHEHIGRLLEQAERKDPKIKLGGEMALQESFPSWKYINEILDELKLDLKERKQKADQDAYNLVLDEILDTYTPDSQATPEETAEALKRFIKVLEEKEFSAKLPSRKTLTQAHIHSTEQLRKLIQSLNVELKSQERELKEKNKRQDKEREVSTIEETSKKILAHFELSPEKPDPQQLKGLEQYIQYLERQDVEDRQMPGYRVKLERHGIEQRHLPLLIETLKIELAKYKGALEGVAEATRLAEIRKHTDVKTFAEQQLQAAKNEKDTLDNELQFSEAEVDTARYAYNNYNNSLSRWTRARNIFLGIQDRKLVELKLDLEMKQRKMNELKARIDSKNKALKKNAL